MIRKNGKQIGFIYKNGKSIDKIYKDNKLIFEKGFDREMLKTSPLNFNGIAKPLKNYEIFGNTRQGRLPSIYQQVEYIESTGTQYINTGLNLNQNSIIDTEFETTNIITNSSAIMGFFGGNTNSFYIYSSMWNDIQLGYGKYTNIQLNFLPNTRYKIKNNKNIFNVNGQDFTISSLTNFTTGNFYIFNMSGGNYVGEPIRLYKLKIYDGQNLVRNFIPCYRKNDNEIGLYDLVNNEFYINKGTGTFLKGDDTPTPNYPQEIESVGELNGYKLTNFENKDSYGNSYNNRLRVNQTLLLKANKTYVFETNLDMPKYIYDFCLATAPLPLTQQTIIAGTDTGWVRENKIHEITTTQDCYFIIVFATSNVVDNLSPSDISKYQFELYEKDKKYKIPVKIEGKNKWELPKSSSLNGIDFINNNDGTFTLNGTASANADFFVTVNADEFENNENYYISSNINKNNVMLLIANYNNNNYVNTITNSNNTMPFKMSITNNQLRFIIRALNGKTFNNVTYKVQLEKGITSTQFEPYYNKIITNIYLNEPLRKIGNYQDYIDFENSKVYRKIKEHYINANDTGEILQTSKSGKYRAIFRNLGALTNVTATQIVAGYSNILKPNSRDYLFQANECFAYGDGGVVTYIEKISNMNFNDYKNWLITNGVYFDFILQNEIVEDIELPQIETINGENILSVDTKIEPSNVYIKYKSGK